MPAVTPDGQWVAFWADGLIKRTPLGGGPVLDVAPRTTVQVLTGGRYIPPSGLAWNAAGDLFVGSVYGPIWQVPPEGKPAAVTKVGEAEVGHVAVALFGRRLSSLRN